MKRKYLWIKTIKEIFSSDKVKKIFKLNVIKLKIKSFIIAAIGFILSPLSWWNDIFVNIPLAYLFALPFGYISESYFLPSMVVGYWITNIIGFIMLHIGLIGIFKKGQEKYTKKQFIKDIIVSVIYTLIVILLIRLNILRLPFEYY